MEFTTLDSLSEAEVIEEGPEEPIDLERIIFEVKGELTISFESPESPIEEKQQYDVPQDKYLEKELERQRQEELTSMLPRRLP
jgi:hypothetical protein